jgi:DNA replication protein DnaC
LFKVSALRFPLDAGAPLNGGFRRVLRSVRPAKCQERASAIANATEVQLLIVDDLGMRKLPANAAEDLLEIVMRRYERASTIITSNRPLEDWPRMFGDTPAVTAFLDRLMHHSHLLELRGKSYRLHQSSVTARQRKATDSK